MDMALYRMKMSLRQAGSFIKKMLKKEALL